MKLSQEQREANLQRIAASSVALERETGIPAELAAGQCIIESGWLAHNPGNNPFGLKSAAAATVYQILETEEDLTAAQIRAVAESGRRIVGMGPVFNGRRRVRIQDRFQVFRSLDEAFGAYGRLLTRGRYFAARWRRYQAHRDLARLLRDMSGADGEPPYFTSPSYLSVFDSITRQENVKVALAQARAANQFRTQEA
jgi:flagellum-specific peptidoglycan hydrolase FlgJ